MTLFDDGAEATLARGVRLVRETLEGLPGGFEERSDPDGATSFRLDRQEAPVRLVLAPDPAGPRLRIEASPVGAPASPDPAHWERLLRANGEGLGGLAWGLVEARVLLVGERPLADLDPSEVVALLEAVAPAVVRARELGLLTG